MYKEMEKINNAIDERIFSNKQLDIIGTIGEKDVQKNIGCLLHCEQITLLKILDEPFVLLPIVKKVSDSINEKIERVSLDIFT